MYGFYEGNIDGNCSYNNRNLLERHTKIIYKKKITLLQKEDSLRIIQQQVNKVYEPLLCCNKPGWQDREDDHVP